MWRWVFRPQVLFLVGTLFALTPYVLWTVEGKNQSYFYEISYVPALIWVGGYLSFYAGVRMARLRRLRSRTANVVRGRATTRLTAIVVVALAFQVVALTAVYGGVPLRQFMTGQSDASQVDASVRANAFMGQMGLYLLTLFSLNALVLILVILRIDGGRSHALLLVTAIAALFAAGVFSGKRQQLAISIMFLACGSSIWFAHPIRPMLRYLGFHRVRWKARVLTIVLPVLLLLFIGFIATLRTGTQMSGRMQVLTYLEIALINLEVQVERAGLGPHELRPVRLLQYMIPDRIAFGGVEPLFAGERPPRAEPSATAGFYGDIHWNTGFGGVLIFAFAAGFIAQYFYRRATFSIFHLLVYAQMAWTLIGAHSYNHFLHSNFLVVPAVAFWIIARITTRRGARRVRHSVARARPASDAPTTPPVQGLSSMRVSE